MNVIRPTLLTLLISLLLACNNEADNQLSAEKEKVPVEAGDVLATIDGVAIRESQLEAVIVDMFGEYKASQMDAQSRKRALDSMLAGYALSQKALVNLPDEQINTIEEKTRRYRENLLINVYIQSKMDASALSSEDIKTYYENNLDKFGKRIVKQYQLLTSRNELAEESRDEYLSVVSSYKQTGDLQEIKKILEKQGFEMQLQSGELDNNLLDKRLRQLIGSQVINQISDTSFINNKPYLVIITSEKVLNARPLIEVKNTIRKTLVLKQLKKAIKKESAEALAESKIVYSH